MPSGITRYRAGIRPERPGALRVRSGCPGGLAWCAAHTTPELRNCQESNPPRSRPLRGPASSGAACLAEVAAGRILWKVPGPDEQAAARSGDGTRIAVRTGDRIVSLDAATGAVVATVPRRAQNRGTPLSFPGGRCFAAAGTRREIHVWDLQALSAKRRKPGLNETPWSRTAHRSPPDLHVRNSCQAKHQKRNAP